MQLVSPLPHGTRRAGFIWLLLAASLPAGLRADGAAFVAPTPPPEVVVAAPATASDAARLLNQATFGPTDDLLAQAQAKGVAGFLHHQIKKVPATSHVAILQQLGVDPNETDARIATIPWWQNAVNAPDQLRQRVAFALSEIMVVSAIGPNEGPYGLSGYMDILCRDAFGTFRQLLEDVTLSPEMGTYLNMRRNDAGNPVKGTHPNENYAREVMQLFTIGLNQLNPDGSPQLDANGQPIPTYTQTDVTSFARVYTGWNYAPAAGQAPSWTASANWLAPMVPVPGHHDTAAKTLLNGVTLPAGGTAQGDLDAALDNLANHPNVGPFFCRLLIQRLVTSNPSPGYVYRVASVFNDDGDGVRGNLAAVVKAILTDYDARSPDLAGARSYGKEREPVVRVASLLRAFHATTPGGQFQLLDTDGYLGQTPLRAPSVFNFFQSGYTPPGRLAAHGLAAPEFELTNTSTALTTANYLRYLIYGHIGTGDSAISLDLSAVQALADSPSGMTAYLNTLLMAGQMSSDMQSTLTTAISAISAKNPLERAESAVQIVVTSPEYLIQR